MLQIRIWLAFLAIFIAFLRFVSGEDVAAANNAPRVIINDPELSKNLEYLKTNEELNEEIKKEALNNQPEGKIYENVIKEEDVEDDKTSRMLDSVGREFDELDDHLLNTTIPADMDEENDDPRTVQHRAVTTPSEILKAMRSLEKFVVAAKDSDHVNQVVTPRMKEIFRSINTYVQRIVALTSHPEDANKFIEKEGFHKCILPNMWIEYPDMRKNLLVLIKQLLEVSSQTTNVIPIELLDQLLRIFENDDNLTHKNLVIDILYIWLPGHPEAQTRVIQLSGLYPFYQHLQKLDTNVVYTMIDLFNILIREHMDVRKNKELYTKEERKIYQRIGLLQQISTRKNCLGFLTIFQDALDYNTRVNNIVIPALELARLVQPTCTKKFQGRKKPMDFFNRLQSYVTENREYLGSFLPNLEEVEAALNDYVEGLKPKHIEL